LSDDARAERLNAEWLAATGWKSATVGGFSGQVGPFWFRRDDSGHRVIGLLVEDRHANSHLGTLHGGVVMTFADIALGAGADDALGGARSVTASLQAHFVSIARIGEFISCAPEVVRRTRNLVFVRGLIVVGERTIASADGIWKVLEPTAGAVAGTAGPDPQS